MDVNFDYKFDPIGGQIQHYLLEKSRVVKQQIGERNFHVFYQLLSSNEENLQNFGLDLSAEDYYYINQGNCCQLEKINDKLNYELVLEAFHIVGFTENEILTIWKIIAAIIHLVSLHRSFQLVFQVFV